mgnify:CR=1 FL=1
MQLLMSIHNYAVENALSIGELNLFSSDNRDEVNRKVVDYLKSLSHQLQNEPNRPTVSLGDTFRLQFRVKENDNDTNWVERINNVGSDGTDILVKAMVNIMLINLCICFLPFYTFKYFLIDIVLPSTPIPIPKTKYIIIIVGEDKYDRYWFI